MYLQEPKIEFVSIDLRINAESLCPSGVVSSTAGGGQRCIASQEDAQLCDDYETNMPWEAKRAQPTSRDSSKGQQPENIVGFDLKFDK